MSEEELKAIEERAQRADWPSTPGFSGHRLGVVVCDVYALAAEVRRLRAERERLAGLLSGIDWRALPDNYKHNLQRAEETAAEALALLEERVDMHREMELENEKLQAENAAIRADVERLRAGEASLRQCIADCIDVWYSDSASDYLGETRWGEKTLAALGMRGLRYDEETGFVEEVTL